MAKKEKTAEGTEGAEAPEAKGSSKKLIIIGVAMLLGGVFAGKMVFGGAAAPGTTIVLPGEATTTSIDFAKATAVPLARQAVNLSDGKYLSFSLTVTLAPEEGAAHEGKVDLASEAPKFEYLRDEAQAFIAGHSSVDVLQKSFKTDLKDHLVERAELVYGEHVANVAVGDWTVAAA